LNAIDLEIKFDERLVNNKIKRIKKKKIHKKII